MQLQKQMLRYKIVSSERYFLWTWRQGVLLSPGRHTNMEKIKEKWFVSYVLITHHCPSESYRYVHILKDGVGKSSGGSTTWYCAQCLWLAVSATSHIHWMLYWQLSTMKLVKNCVSTSAPSNIFVIHLNLCFSIRSEMLQLATSHVLLSIIIV